MTRLAAQHDCTVANALPLDVDHLHCLHGIVGGHDLRRAAACDGLNEIPQLFHPAIRRLAGDRLSLAVLLQQQRVLSAQIEIGGGVLEIHGVPHGETKAIRHAPPALGSKERRCRSIGCPAFADPIQAIDILGRHIQHVHIKDAIASAEPRIQWGKEVPFGTGQVEPKRFLDALQSVGFTGALAIEREAGPNRVADVRAAVAALLAAE